MPIIRVSIWSHKFVLQLFVQQALRGPSSPKSTSQTLQCEDTWFYHAWGDLNPVSG